MNLRATFILPLIASISMLSGQQVLPEVVRMETLGTAAAGAKDFKGAITYLQRGLNLSRGTPSIGIFYKSILVELAGAEHELAVLSAVSEQEALLATSVNHYREYVALDPEVARDTQHIYQQLLRETELDLRYAHAKNQPMKQANISAKDRKREIEQAGKKNKNSALVAEASGCEAGVAAPLDSDEADLHKKRPRNSPDLLCFNVSRALITAEFRDLAGEFYQRGVALDPRLPSKGLRIYLSFEDFAEARRQLDAERSVQEQEDRARTRAAILGGVQEGLSQAAESTSQTADAVRAQNQRTMELGRASAAGRPATSGAPVTPQRPPSVSAASQGRTGTPAGTGLSGQSCHSMNSAVMVQGRRLEGAGHCSGEVVMTIVNNASQPLTCTYAYHKNGNWAMNDRGTVDIQGGGRLSGELSGLWACDADSTEVQYACFEQSEERTNLCTANVGWK